MYVKLFDITDRRKLKDKSAIHHLRPSTARSLLKHSAIVLVAHIGYESASDIAINTLADVVEHFLQRMTFLLKAAVEQPDDGFPVNLFSFVSFFYNVIFILKYINSLHIKLYSKIHFKGCSGKSFN